MKCTQKSGKVIISLILLLIISLLSGAKPINGFRMMDTVQASGDFMYFPYPVYTVSEGCQIADVPLYRERQYKYIISAEYTTADITAIGGLDYTVSQGTKTMNPFTQGELSIPILEDTIGESNEEFTITLSGQYTRDDPANGYYISCTVIIEDNDGGASLSDNNLLSSMEISNGVLQPSFSGTTEAYNVDVTDSVGNISIRALPEDSNATIEVCGIPVQSGIWCNPIALSSGVNNISVAVEAENGDTRIYAVTVNRDILPVVNLYRNPLENLNGNVISSGNDIFFQGIHAITVYDISTTGWGFRLRLNIDEYVKSASGSIDDPTKTGVDWIELEIPTTELCTLNLSSVTYPDETDVIMNTSIDYSETELSLGNYSIVAYEDTSGETGLYIIYLIFTVKIPEWIPENSIIHYYPSADSTIVGSEDMKQMYESTYSYEISYELERIFQP